MTTKHRINGTTADDLYERIPQPRKIASAANTIDMEASLLLIVRERTLAAYTPAHERRESPIVINTAEESPKPKSVLSIVGSQVRTPSRMKELQTAENATKPIMTRTLPR